MIGKNITPLPPSICKKQSTEYFTHTNTSIMYSTSSKKWPSTDMSRIKVSKFYQLSLNVSAYTVGWENILPLMQPAIHHYVICFLCTSVTFHIHFGKLILQIIFGNTATRTIEIRLLHILS